MNKEELWYLLIFFTIFINGFELANYCFNGFYNRYRLLAYVCITFSTWMMYLIGINNKKEETNND